VLLVHVAPFVAVPATHEVLVEVTGVEIICPGQKQLGVPTEQFMGEVGAEQLSLFVVDVVVLQTSAYAEQVEVSGSRATQVSGSLVMHAPWVHFCSVQLRVIVPPLRKPLTSDLALASLPAKAE
jgi:hypothetical protein